MASGRNKARILIPTDGLQEWLIVISIVVDLFITSGMPFALTIRYEDLLNEVFHKTRVPHFLTAQILVTPISIPYILIPCLAKVIEKYPCEKRLHCVGAVGCCIAFMIVSVELNAVINICLHITSAILAGIGSSLCIQSSISILHKYFRQNLCFAMVLANVGKHLGIIILSWLAKKSQNFISLEVYFILCALITGILLIPLSVKWEERNEGAKEIEDVKNDSSTEAGDSPVDENTSLSPDNTEKLSDENYEKTDSSSQEMKSTSSPYKSKIVPHEKECLLTNATIESKNLDATMETKTSTPVKEKKDSISFPKKLISKQLRRFSLNPVNNNAAPKEPLRRHSCTPVKSHGVALNNWNIHSPFKTNSCVSVSPMKEKLRSSNDPRLSFDNDQYTTMYKQRMIMANDKRVYSKKHSFGPRPLLANDQSKIYYSQNSLAYNNSFHNIRAAMEEKRNRSQSVTLMKSDKRIIVKPQKKDPIVINKQAMHHRSVGLLPPLYPTANENNLTEPRRHSYANSKSKRKSLTHYQSARLSPSFKKKEPPVQKNQESSITLSPMISNDGRKLSIRSCSDYSVPFEILETEDNDGRNESSLLIITNWKYFAYIVIVCSIRSASYIYMIFISYLVMNYNMAILSCIGISSLLGQVVNGVIGDYEEVNRMCLMGGFALAGSVSIILNVTSDHFVIRLCSALLFGFTTSINSHLFTALLTEIVTTNNHIAIMYDTLQVSQGVFLQVLTGMIGFLFDSYWVMSGNELFYTCGILMGFGSILTLMLFMNTI